MVSWPIKSAIGCPKDYPLFQWRPPQEQELRVEPGDLEGAARAADSPELPPALPAIPHPDGAQSDEEVEAEEGQRWLGRSEGSRAVPEHDPAHEVRARQPRKPHAYPETNQSVARKPSS